MTPSTHSTARSSQVASGLGGLRTKCAQIIGVSVSDTAVDTAIAKASVTENSRNTRPTTPLMNSSGMKAATSEMLIEITVNPIWRAPSIAARHRRHALLEIAEAVLDHHDGVVDHEADRDRERHQREIVDREARDPHHRAGAGERQRHRDAGGDRRRRAPQEQEHHQHDQSDGRQQRELHVERRWRGWYWCGRRGRRCRRRPGSSA